GVQIGIRKRTRPDIGKLVWHVPHRGMVLNILRNPIYAGAYVYGRRRTDPRRQQPGRPASGRTPFLPPERWQVWLRDRFPAYITWEHYEQIQQKMKLNRERSVRNGAYGNGAALLSGIVMCGRCNFRMNTLYQKSKNGHRYARYVCNHAYGSHG